MKAIPSTEEREELYCICKHLRRWERVPKDFHFCFLASVQYNGKSAVPCQKKK